MSGQACGSAGQRDGRGHSARPREVQGAAQHGAGRCGKAVRGKVLGFFWKYNLGIVQDCKR